MNILFKVQESSSMVEIKFEKINLLFSSPVLVKEGITHKIPLLLEPPHVEFTLKMLQDFKRAVERKDFLLRYDYLAWAVAGAAKISMCSWF